MKAFLGEPAVKADLLAAIAASKSYQDPACTLLKYGVQSDEFEVCCEQFGLPADFARLAVQTMPPSGGRSEEDFNWDALSALMAEIRPGADLSMAAHHWVIWAWAAASEPLCAWLQDSPVLAAPGEKVVALHRRLVDGGVVDAAEWRAVRRMFPQAAPATAQDHAAAAVAAAAWDFAKVPGAAADVLVAWRDLYEVKLRTEMAWTRALDEEARQERLAEWEPVYASVGPQFADETDVAFRDRKHAALSAHMQAQGADPAFRASALAVRQREFYSKFIEQTNAITKAAAAGLAVAVQLAQRNVALAAG